MTHEEKVRRALSFVALMGGDERGALNAMYSKALADEVSALSAKLTAMTKARDWQKHLVEARNRWHDHAGEVNDKLEAENEVLRAERDYLRDVVLKQANRITELQAEKDALLGDLANLENGQRVKGQS